MAQGGVFLVGALC